MAIRALGIMPLPYRPHRLYCGLLLPHPEQKFPVFWAPQLVQNHGPAASGLGLPQLPQNFPEFREPLEQVQAAPAAVPTPDATPAATPAGCA